MSAFWWLILGLLAGWLIELAIDYRYWRRHALSEAARIAQQEAALAARSTVLDEQQAVLEQRDEELSTRQATLNAKDAELLAQAKRIDERAEEVTRLEQAMDKRRADLDRMGLTLNEREKDIATRSDALKAHETDVAARTSKLDAGEADVSRRVAVVSNRESAMQNWEARILAREHEVGDKEAELVRKAATADQLSLSLAAVKGLMQRQYQTTEGADDLQAIEGIGPKIASLLHNADIRSFDRLSETSVGELSRLLESGGSRFGLADPMTWAEQASLLVNGDYVAFEQLKAELAGGVRRDAALLLQAQQPGGQEQNSGNSGADASAGPLFEAASTAGPGAADAEGAVQEEAGQPSDTSTKSDPD